MTKASSQHNLSKVNPEIAKEWHPSKNSNLTPKDVTPRSSKKVWWQCKKGHEWESIISNRSRLKRSCPYCANQKVCEDNCLTTINPILAKEWHPTKNGKLTPKDVTPGSSRQKVWWRCHNGHVWQAIVKSRSNGCGCPFCSNKKVGKDNSLAFKNPKLAKEWSPSKNGSLSPEGVTPRSGKKVWWACKKGHEYKASVDNRSKGKGCPYCSNRRVCDDNSLTSKSPKLANEWHPTKNGNLTPKDVVPGYARKVWWQCKRGHSWQAAVNSRSMGSGCPDCSPQTSVAELRIFSEIKHIFPDSKLREKIALMECDIYIPSHKVGVEYDGEYWHRNKGLKDRTKNIVLESKGIKLIRVREKGLSKVTAHDIIYDSRKNKDKWLINEVLKTIRGIVSLSDYEKKRVDKYLRGTRLANNKMFLDLQDRLPSPPLSNSLAVVKPNLCREWHPSKNGALTPYDVRCQSNKKIWWQCDKGHEWQSQVNSRFRGRGCPCCAGWRVTPETSLARKNPKLAKEWHPSKNGALIPEEVTSRSGKKIWWQCDKGHEWQSSVSNRLKSGCPYCGNKKVCKDNCLATVKPKLAVEWHHTKNGKLTAKDVVFGSHKKVWWQCHKDHEWKAKVVDRFSGNGCPCCSGRRVCKENNLAIKNPKLAKEWHPTKNGTLTPAGILPCVVTAVWWRCDKGHEWKDTLNRRSRGSGCLYCVGTISTA